MGPLAQRDINRLAFKCWCSSSFGQHRNLKHALVWQHLVRYVESEMSKLYIKERRRARCSEREGRMEIEKSVLEHDRKEFRSPGIELQRTAWMCDFHILLHHWNSPGCLWVDAPSPGIVMESCSHGDCGLVFQITLYWKEAGIPWRIPVLDLEVGRQRSFQRCLRENWNVHRGQLKENLLYPHQDTQAGAIRA